MTSIAIIGSKGFVGSALYQEFLTIPEYSVVGVTLDNYSEMKEQNYDVVINCAMPSGRFWAKNNPKEDFIETVKKTADFLYEWKFKKFLQISTVSARCQLNTTYGRHKAAAEKLMCFGENLVIRLGAIYNENNKKGVLVDMMQNKKVFVDGSSRYSFISLDYCANWIAHNLHRAGVVELGGKNAIALKDVAKYMGKNVVFDGDINHQDVENDIDDLPQASDVLGFIGNFKKLS